MVWSIETDDFHGTCHDVTFPLIKTIVETMNGPIVYPTPPTGEVTTATSTPTPGRSTTPQTTPPTGEASSTAKSTPTSGGSTTPQLTQPVILLSICCIYLLLLCTKKFHIVVDDFDKYWQYSSIGRNLHCSRLLSGSRWLRQILRVRRSWQWLDCKLLTWIEMSILSLYWIILIWISGHSLHVRPRNCFQSCHRQLWLAL